VRGTSVAAGEVAMIAHPRVFGTERFLAHVAFRGATELLGFLRHKIRHGDYRGNNCFYAARQIVELIDEPRYTVITAVKLKTR